MLEIEPIRILDSYQAKGLIHVGANDGEEIPYYKSRGIQNLMMFEPLAKPYAKMVELYPDVKAYYGGLSNKSESRVMTVTENDKASSTLELIDCDDYENHPVFKDWNMGQLPKVGEVTAYFERFDDVFSAKDYDVLVIDAQGMEREVLEGFGNELDHIKVAVIECSETPVYKGEASASEIIQFMSDKGFEQRTPVKLHNDILFTKRGLGI